MVEIILFAAGFGAAVTLALFSFIRRKERNLKLFAACLLLAFTSCTGSKHAGRYLVSVRAFGKQKIDIVQTRTEADSIVTRALDGELMGKRKSFFEIRNSEVFIYVEKKE